MIVNSLGSWLTARLRRRTADGRYRPEIDGLRFIAVALVVLGHLMERCARSVPNSAGVALGEWLSSAKAWAGVLLFFTVSGFIITSQFLKIEDRRISRGFLKSYFRRRVLRIEPPYLILLTLTYFIIKLTGYLPPVSQRFWDAPRSIDLSFLASITYLHGLIFNTYPRLFPPGWSLEIEVQFYLMAPILFFLYFKLRDRRVRTAIGAVVLGCFVAVSVLLPPSAHAPFLQRSLIIDLPQFWLGVLLADAQADLRKLLQGRGRLAAGLGWMGALLFVGWDILWRVGGPLGAVSAQFALLLGTFLMFCGVFGEGGFRRFCALPFVSIVGGACYSVYLTHLQVMQVLTPAFVHVLRLSQFALVYPAALILELPVVLAVAMGFHVLLERPFMAVDWPSRVWRWLQALRLRPARAN